MLTLLCFMVGVIGLVRIWQASVQLELLFVAPRQKREHGGLYISYKVVTIGGLTLVVLLILMISAAAIEITS